MVSCGGTTTAGTGEQNASVRDSGASAAESGVSGSASGGTDSALGSGGAFASGASGNGAFGPTDAGGRRMDSGTRDASSAGGAAGAEPECALDSDCRTFDDCCTCAAYAVGGRPPDACPADCVASQCSRRFGGTGAFTARCRAGRCVPAGLGSCDSSQCATFDDTPSCCTTPEGPCGLVVFDACVTGPVDAGASSDPCAQPLVMSSCLGGFDSFGYDQTVGACVPFIYGGCGGNDNRFLTLEECRATCEP